LYNHFDGQRVEHEAPDKYLKFHREEKSMKFKRFLAAMLAGVMVLSLAACGGSDSGATSDVKAACVLGVGGLGDQGYNDLIYAGMERAKEELEKERERKRLRTLYKTTKTKESTSNTICSMSTNGSDISYISTNSFQKEEQQQYFSNNIIDYSKSSRENLYHITKQLNEILNMNNKKKSNTKGYKKQIHLQI
jgi:basic membrane lipoprotein Med (substrate-binding protein (PBP1-ABC) superfamily)